MPRRGVDGDKRIAPHGLAAAGTKRTNAGDLFLLDPRIDLEDPRPGAIGLHVPIEADDDRLASVDGLLCRIGRILYLPLNEPRLDRGQRATDPVDAGDQFHHLALDATG